MKRVTQPQLPNFDVDGYGMQQQVYIEQDDDDSPSRKKKSEPRSCLSYVVLAFLFFSALYGMASLSGAPITDSAAAMARQKFQSFESSLAHFPLQSAGVAPAIPPQPSILENPADKIEHVIPVVLAKLIPPPIPSAEDILADLHKQVKAQEDIVRAIKQKGTVMEEDEQAKIETGKLQDLCRQYVPMKYGPGPYYLKFDLVFPETMPDFETAGSDGSFVVQMGPVQHVPYSVFFVSSQA